ncbi:MAG: ATP-binding protein [Pseudomonadota bacterium]
MSAAGKQSIGNKLNLILTMTTLFALVIAGLALIAFDQQSQRQSLLRDAVTQADIMGLVSSSALAFDDARVAAENLSVLRLKSNVTAAALFDVHGKLFASFDPAEGRGGPLPQAAEASGTQLGWDVARVWRPIISQGEKLGMVYLEVRHSLLARALEYLGVLAIIMSASMAVALLLSNRLQRSITGPIGAVSDVAREIMQRRDFKLRAPKTSDDEIGTLVELFNAMLDELGERAAILERANQALRDSEERYQLAVRGSSAGLWDWDLDGNTTFFSPRVRDLLGYTEAEFPDLPTSPGRIMHPADVPMVRQALKAHLAHDVPYQIECRLRLKNGEWRWFTLSGMALKDAAGHPFRMAGSIIDVTERKEAEQVVKDANRAKDEFLATLAHELRNPLAPIRTGLDILKRHPEDGEMPRRARETMDRQLAHMVRLIDDLMDISRITSGKIRLDRERLDVATAVNSALEIGQASVEARGHRLDVDLPAGPLEVMADPTRLAQAIGNLLNNAAKYTPPGGRIGVRVWREGDEAVIAVSDTGVGIPADMLDKVFQLFTQVGRTLDRAQGGLGIGLYLVRTLVQLHGGSIAASSPGADAGTVFTVRIPCLGAIEAANVPVHQEEAMNASAEGLRVLVVDDNVDAAETLAAVLDLMGHRTRTHFEGMQVCEVALDFRPDLILLDIGLPGLTGYEVAAQLRRESRLAGIVLVALTGWGSDNDRQRSFEAGFDEHLTKPVDLSALERVLKGLSDAG